MTEETTPRGYQTIIGQKEKQIEELEAKVQELTPPQRSAGSESFKEAVRTLLSLLIGMGVTYAYQRYPLLGTLQPDQTALVIAIVGVTVRSIDKFHHQWLKNRGKVARGTGLDIPLQTIANIMDGKKGKSDQMS